MPGIVVLIGGTDLSRRVAETIVHRFPDAVFLCPQPTSRAGLLRRRIRRHGLIKAAGQVGFRALLQRLSRRVAPRIDQIWQDAGLGQDNVPKAQWHSVSGINGPDTQQLLAQLTPDVVFVFSVPKISAETLAVVDAPFVNLHPGMTPHYRGVHTGYWALAQGEAERFGATIHLIDTGLDTGPILTQIAQAPRPGDGVATYNTLLTVGALPAVFDVLAAACNNHPLHPITPGPPAPIFHEPTIWRYVWTGLRRGVW